MSFVGNLNPADFKTRSKNSKRGVMDSLLVIDNEKAIRYYISEYLVEAGYEVKEAREGEKCRSVSGKVLDLPSYA